MHDTLPPDLQLSLQQRVLMTTDGTVTDLISLFSGEAIHITKLEQGRMEGRGPRELQLARPVALLHRVILLSGAHRHYLHAESHFVLHTLSDSLQQALLQSDTPIGLLWKQARLETFREPVAQSLDDRPDLRGFFPDSEDARFLSRSYRVIHQGETMGLITEKFPLSYFG